MHLGVGIDTACCASSAGICLGDSSCRATATRAVIQGIKQRLLTFLFLEAQRSCASRPGVNGCSEAMRPLQLFYRHFEDYLSLLMLRVALVSDSQVAMLLAHPDVTVSATRKCGVR